MNEEVTSTEQCNIMKSHPNSIPIFESLKRTLRNFGFKLFTLQFTRAAYFFTPPAAHIFASPSVLIGRKLVPKFAFRRFPRLARFPLNPAE